MEVSLSRAQAAFAAEQVERGSYIDEAEVVRDALRRMQQREAPAEDIFELMLELMKEMAAEKRADRAAIAKEVNVKIRTAQEALDAAVRSVTEAREAADKWQHAFQQLDPASTDTPSAPSHASPQPTDTEDPCDG